MIISEQDELTSRFQTCRLHDMMREVCLLKAEDENFLQIVHNSSTTSFCKSRRLAVHSFNETYSQMVDMGIPKLRSLLSFGNSLKEIRRMKSAMCFKRFQLMRVLDLSYAEFKGKELPSSIGKLIHLRYLNLCQALVSHLPSSMRNLKKLLYLNLDVCSRSLVFMPNFMKNMGELAYLHLPLKIHDEVKLELGNLVKLETLKNFSTKNSSLKDLHQMTRLETLSIIYNGGSCTMETLSSSLSRQTHLEIFKVYADKKAAPRNNDEGFVLNCNHLKNLVLRTYMPKLPDEQNFLSHLTTIALEDCCLKEDPMPILEKGHQLQEVELNCNSFCGRRMVCSTGGFPKLQELRLHSLGEWEEWIVEKDSMPLLRNLDIGWCPKLRQLPDGLRFLTSLKIMDIKFGNDLNKEKEWMKILSKRGKDYYKVQHIPFLVFNMNSGLARYKYRRWLRLQTKAHD